MEESNGENEKLEKGWEGGVDELREEASSEMIETGRGQDQLISFVCDGGCGEKRWK